MTDPDPLAGLAAQLEQLRGQLARTQGELGAVRERLEGADDPHREARPGECQDEKG